MAGYGGYIDLLYLRARWYAPETGTFLSKDAWAGTNTRPDTLHSYLYTNNNPVNRLDPTGYDYVPSWDRYTCGDSHERGGYVYHYDKATAIWGWWPCLVYNYPGAIPEGALNYPQPGNPPPPAQPTPPTTPSDPSQNNEYGLITGIDGYVEGLVETVTTAFCTISVTGKEVVYDFRSKQRARFTYEALPGKKGVSTNLLDGSVLMYAGPIWGFSGIGIQEYEGVFWGGTVGTSVPLPQLGNAVYINAGISVFSGVDDNDMPNFDLWGVSVPVGMGGGISFWDIPINIGVGWTDYTIEPESKYADYTNYSMMFKDILTGVDSPIPGASTRFGVNLREIVVDSAKYIFEQ